VKDMVVYERITFLHILQEVRGIGETRNQLKWMHGWRDYDIVNLAVTC
jgi:hypothetical protein